DRTCHRFQAFYRWVGPFTPSGFGFRQFSFTHRRRVLRMPCPTTLSGMHRLPGMLGLLQFSPPDMPVTQKPLPSFSCLQQGSHNAPHGAHRTDEFPGIRLSLYVSLKIVSIRERTRMELLMAWLTKDECFPASCSHQLLPLLLSMSYILEFMDVMNLKCS